MTRLDRWIDRFTFGGRIPGGVGLVLAVTVATSLVAAFGSRHVAPLFEYAALVPHDVWRGQLWRLVSWGFIETNPLRLLFACLFLYWFGRDLAEDWGSRWFVVLYLGVEAVASLGTCALALVDHAIMPQAFVGSWPLTAAMAVAWGIWFPNRVIRLYFVFEVRGAVVAWLTVGLTVAFAIYSGWEQFAPALFAEGSVITLLFRRSIAGQWTLWRHARRKRARAARRATHERELLAASGLQSSGLDAPDEELPPLPPEIESALDRIVKQAGARPKRKDIA